MRSTRFPVAILASLAIVAIGCQKSGQDRPKTFPVSGIVTLDGEPVEGAIVSFVPQGEGAEAAAGTTDGTGKYELTTFAKGDGAVPGQYQIKVVKFEQAATAAAEEGEAGGSAAIPGDEAYAAPGDEEGDSTPPANLLPQKYAEPSSSGLTASVTEGENKHDLPLVKE